MFPYKETISEISGISVQDIESKSRSREIAELRQVIMFLMFDFGYKYSEIAKYLNLNSHQTAMHGVSKIKDLLFVKDSKIRHLVSSMISKINESSLKYDLMAKNCPFLRNCKNENEIKLVMASASWAFELADKMYNQYEEKLRWVPVDEKEPESFKNDEDGIYYSKYLELKVNGYEYPLIGYYVNANDDQFFDIISEKDDDIKQEDITHFRECFL